MAKPSFCSAIVNENRGLKVMQKTLLFMYSGLRIFHFLGQRKLKDMLGWFPTTYVSSPTSNIIVEFRPMPFSLGYYLSESTDLSNSSQIL